MRELYPGLVRLAALAVCATALSWNRADAAPPRWVDAPRLAPAVVPQPVRPVEYSQIVAGIITRSGPSTFVSNPWMRHGSSSRSTGIAASTASASRIVASSRANNSRLSIG